MSVNHNTKEEDIALLNKFTAWVSGMPNKAVVFSNGICVILGDKGDMCVRSTKKVYYEGGILGVLSHGARSIWEMLRDLIVSAMGTVTSLFHRAMGVIVKPLVDAMEGAAPVAKE